MGPNTTIAPAVPQTFFQKLFGVQNTPSDVLGVRGSVPPSGGGKNARPVQMGPQWGQAGGGVNTFDQRPTRDMTSMYAQQYGPQAPQVPNTIGGPGPNRFNPLAPQVSSPQLLAQYANYGLPDTVRETLLNQPKSAYTNDEINVLLPGQTNSQIYQAMTSQGFVFDMQNNRWETPSGTAAPSTTQQPAAPKSGYGGAWEGTEGYGDGLRSQDSFENYKQNFKAKKGRDAKRWWVKTDPKFSSASTAPVVVPTPQNPDGQVNSLVSWSV
jgi:hypothetical protein